jgi:mannose-6-phosphate isomerase-like protein (cupin superfamily)
MHTRKVTDISQPLRSPLGETVYELVGTAQTSGQTNKQSLAYIVIPPGGCSSHHYHLVTEESYFIISGKAQMVVDGELISLSSGQACLIKPPSRHEITNNGDIDLVFLAVCAPAWAPTDSFLVEKK